MARSSQSLVRRLGAARGAAGAADLRRELESLGPAFVKIGRYLALRPDLISPEHCGGLLALVDQAPPLPWADVRRVLSEDLGGDFEEHFTWISPRMLASGSLAQVHVGRTRDGTEVAVKILREGVARDLARGRQIARALDLAGVSSGRSSAEVVEELRGWLESELDAEHELRNLERMSELLAGSRCARIPRPFPELSGRRVVVRELLRGVPVSELLREVRAGRRDQAAALGVDLEALAASLVEVALTQVFDHRFFQADTHPANLVAFADGVVGFADFGLATRLDETGRQSPLRYLSAVLTGNAQDMHHAAGEVLGWHEESDTEGFRRDFLAAARTWLVERGDGGPPREPGAPPLVRFMAGVLRSARRHRLPLSVPLRSMHGALLTAETVASELAPEADLWRMRERFVSRLSVRRALQDLGHEQVAIDLLTMAREGPGQLQRLLSDLADGRFILPVRTTDSVDERREANTRTRLVTAAILSLAFAFLLVGFRERVLFGFVPLWVVFATLLGAAFLAVGLLWRRLL